MPLLMAVIAVLTWVALSAHDWLTLLGTPSVRTPSTFGIVVSLITGGHITDADSA